MATYQKQDWQNLPNETTPVSAERLNHIEDGIYNASVDANIEDSGWQNATLTNKFELYNSSQVCRYRKIGKLVQINGQVKPTAVITGGTSNTTTMFTLPSAYIPNATITTICQGSGVNKWLLTIQSGGDVCVSRYGVDDSIDIPTTAWLTFEIMYFVD